MPYNFDDIYSAYQGSGLTGQVSLADFAKLGNFVTGSNDFDQAATGGAVGQSVKEGSYWLNKGIGATGLPQASGDVMSSIFGAMGGTPEAGRQVGEGLPRSAVNFAPMMVAGALAPETGGASLLPFLGTAALQGSETYEQTGSPGQAALSAALPAVGMGVSKLAGEAMMPAMQEMAKTSPFWANAFQFGGTQIAAIGAMEGTGRLFGQNQTPFFSADNALQMIFGNLPFMGIEAAKGIHEGGFLPKVAPSEQGIPTVGYEDLRKQAADASFEDAMRARTISQLPSELDQVDAKEGSDQLFKTQMARVQDYGDKQLEQFEGEGGLIPEVKSTTILGTDARQAATMPVPSDTNPTVTPAVDAFKVVNRRAAVQEGEEGVVPAEEIAAARQALEAVTVPTPEEIDSHQKAAEALLQANALQHAATGDPVTDADVQARTQQLVADGNSPVEAMQKAVSSSLQEAKQAAQDQLASTLHREGIKAELARINAEEERESPQEIVGATDAPKLQAPQEVGKAKLQGEELRKARAEGGKKGGAPLKIAYNQNDNDAMLYYGNALAQARGGDQDMQRLIATVKPAFEHPETFFNREGGTNRMRPDVHIDVLRAFRNFLANPRRQFATIDEKVSALTSLLSKTINGTRSEAKGLQTVSLTPELEAEISNTIPAHDSSSDGLRAIEASADHVTNLMLNGSLGDILEAAKYGTPLYRAITEHSILGERVQAAEERLPKELKPFPGQSPGLRQVVRDFFNKDPEGARAYLRGLAQDAAVRGNNGTVFDLNQQSNISESDAAAKRDGFNGVGFHGTTERWTTYNLKAERGTTAPDKAIYVTDSEDEARLAASPDKTKAVVMRIYTKTQNPLIIDAKGTSKDRSFGKAGYKKAIEIAKAQGHDSVIVKNVIDFGDTPQTTTILFDPSQIRVAPETTIVRGNTGEVGSIERPETPAGPGLRYKLQDLFQLSPKGDLQFGLGSKRFQVMNDGTVGENVFDSVTKAAISKDELAMWRMVVPNAWKEGRVNVRELAEGLKDMPQVKVTRMDAERGVDNKTVEDARGAVDLAEHALDTASRDWRSRNSQIESTPRGRELMDNWRAATQRFATIMEHGSPSGHPSAWTGRGAADAYSPDYLKGKTTLQDGKQKAVWAGDISVQAPLERGDLANKREEFQALSDKSNRSPLTPAEDARMLELQQTLLQHDNPYFKPNKGALFHSQHYTGPEGANQLAFVRGVVHEYQPGAKLPDGSIATKVERVMEVNEVQSDWAASQAQRIKEANEPRHDITDPAGGVMRASAIRERLLANTAATSHPLLSHWEPLALKSAINEAITHGATKLVVSDAETGMMTEGHDQHASRGEVKLFDHAGEADAYAKEFNGTVSFEAPNKYTVTIPTREPSQAKGMRAAYDVRIPNILAKLTGDRGQPVEMGVHEKALAQASIQPGETARLESKGSPVFRDALGNPKTQNTGRQFDLFSLIADRTAKSQPSFPLIGNKGENVAREGVIGSNLERDQLRLTLPQVFAATLVKQGVPEAQASYLTKSFLGPISKVLALKGVHFGEVVDDLLKGTSPVGLSTVSGTLRQIWLGTDLSNTKLMADTPRMQARALAVVLAHEGGHQMEQLRNLGLLDTETAKHFDRMVAGFDSRTPEENLTLLKMMAESMLPKTWQKHAFLKDEAGNYIAPANSQEAMADAHAIWAISHAADEVDSTLAGTLMDFGLRSWFGKLTDFVRSLVGSVKSALFVRPEYGDVDAVGRIAKQFDMMRKGFAEASNRATDFAKFFGVDQDSLGPIRASEWQKMALAPKTREYGPESVKDKTIQLASEWMEPGELFARRVPPVAEAMWAVLDMPMHTRMAADRMLAPIYCEVDKDGNMVAMSPEREAQLKLVSDDPVINRIASDIQLKEQDELDKGNVKMFDPAKPGSLDPDLGTRYAALSLKEQQAVSQYLVSQRASNKVTQAEILEGIGKDNSIRLGMVIASRDPSMRDNALAIADQLSQAARLGEQVDKMSKMPAGTVDLNQMMMLEQQQQQMMQAITGKGPGGVRVGPPLFKDPTTEQAALDFAQSAAQGVGQMETFFEGRPNFVSRIVTGSHIVRGYDASGKQVGAEAIKSSSGRDAVEAVLRKKGATRFDVETIRRGVDVDLDDKLREMIDHVENSWTQKMRSWLGKGIDVDGFNEFVDRVPLSGEFERLKQASKIVEPGSRARTTADTIDMVDAHRDYAAILARTLASRVANSKLSFEFQNPALKKFPTQVEQVKQALKNYQTPDSEVGRTITKIMATHYLGMNIPTDIAVAAHGLFVGLPHLVRKTGSFVDSTRLFMGAVKDLAQHFATRKGGLENWGDADERLNFKSMKASGLDESHIFSDALDDPGLSAVRLHQMAAKGTAALALSKAGGLWNAYSNSTMRFFEHFAKWNTRVMGLAGYRANRAAGMDHQTAVNDARRFTMEATFQGGKAGRPVAPFSGKSHFMGQVAYCMQRYVLGCISMIGGYMQHATMSDAECKEIGLPLQDRGNARKALLTTLGIRLGAAGLMGLPGMGAANYLLEKLTGHGIGQTLYQKLGAGLDQDDKEGSMLADVATHGFTNAMLARAGVPVDLASKFAMAGIPGMSSQDGFDPSAIFGPSASMLKSMVTGVMGYAKDGNLANFGKTVLPPAYRQAVDLWANGDETDKEGRPMGDNDLEKTLYATGFHSQRTSRAREFQHYDELLKTQATTQEKRDVAQVLDYWKTGDVAGAQQKLSEIVEAGAGKKDLDHLAKEVAKRVVATQFPQDPREGPNSATAEQAMQVMRGMGLPLPPSQELAKKLAEEYVANSLGAGSRTPRNNWGGPMGRAAWEDQSAGVNPMQPFQMAFR